MPVPIKKQTALVSPKQYSRNAKLRDSPLIKSYQEAKDLLVDLAKNPIFDRHDEGIRAFQRVFL